MPTENCAESGTPRCDCPGGPLHTWRPLFVRHAVKLLISLESRSQGFAAWSVRKWARFRRFGIRFKQTSERPDHCTERLKESLRLLPGRDLRRRDIHYGRGNPLWNL